MVKTKFDSIVKFKKLKVDEVNKDISKLEAKINKIIQEYEALKQEIDEFQYPTKGNFSLITQFKILLKAKIDELDKKQKEIDIVKKQKEILLDKLQEVNLDYEKMKYIQSQEIKKIIENIKKDEQKKLDEIALMLYKGDE